MTSRLSYRAPYSRMTLLLATTALIGGCTADPLRTSIMQDTDRAQRGLESARTPSAPKKYNPLQVTDQVWVGNSSLRLRRGVPLPTKYEEPRGVALISGENMSLKEIATALGAQTGIPIRIADDIGNSIPSSSIHVPNEGGGGSMTTPSSPRAGMPVTYEGKLSGLLDLVAGYYGVNWRYDGTSINFARFETRVFVVEALPGTQTVSDDMGGDEGGGGSSGGGGGGDSSSQILKQKSETSFDLKVWEELTQTITAMLGGVGSVTAAPSSGTITVITTPEQMTNVAKFMEEENIRLSQQIAINVEIYRVDLSDSNGLDISFKNALQLVNGSGLNVQYTGPTASNVGTITGVNASGGSLNVAILNGDVSGIFSAISQLGDASRVAQFPMTTLNNRPVSRKIGNETAYVSSVTTTLADVGGQSQTSLETAKVSDGFSIQLLPRLLEDGRIMMQYSLMLTDLVNIRKFEVEGDSPVKVELPEIASRVFIQQAMLKSGSTMFIGGYDDRNDKQNSQGVGSPFNFLFGGGYNETKKRSMMFIAITPQVLEVPRAEND